jgi:hypothetical protein
MIWECLGVRKPALPLVNVLTSEGRYASYQEATLPSEKG